MIPRALAPLVPLALASGGCLVIDGFGDLAGREGGTAATTSGDATTTTVSAGGGDGGAGTTTSTGASSSQGGGPGSGGGGGGSGGLDRVGDVVRFGATGSAGCVTRVTDVLRIEDATVVAGVTASTGGPCDIVPLDDDAVIDFGDTGGRRFWVVVVADDDEVLRVLQLEFADDLAADISGVDVEVVPIRLHRVEGQPGPIVTRTSSFEQTASELRIGRLDPVSFDLEPIAQIQAYGDATNPPTALATEVVGDADRLVVVGALQSEQPFVVTGVNGAPCDAGSSFMAFDHAFHWDLLAAGAACPLAELPGFVAWSAVTEGEGALVGLWAPTFDVDACDFADSGDRQEVARVSGAGPLCEDVLASYPITASSPFSLALARDDRGPVVAYRLDDGVHFGALPEAPSHLSAVPGIVDMARLRGAGARHVLGGSFGGSLELDGVVVLENDGLRTDGFVAIAPGPAGPAPQLLSLGGEGDDAVTSVDVEPALDGVLVVGGTYGGAHPTLDLAAPETAGASYLVRFRLGSP